MKKHTIIFLMIVVYIFGISGYSYYSYYKTEKDILKGIDEKLLAAVSAITYIIGKDYHLKIVDKNSISEEDYLATSDILVEYISGIKNLLYLTTFIKDSNGTLRFAATNLPKEQLEDGTAPMFYDAYEDEGDRLLKAFYEKEPQYSTTKDKWGTYRTVMKSTTYKGVTYLSSGDIDIQDVEQILQQELFNAILTGLFFLIILIPIVILYIRNIEQEKKSLESVIEEKTKELIKINQDLKNLSNQLAKYMSPQVYNSIFSSKKEVKIESKRKKLTIFFSDIKNFTETTENLEPEDLTYLLNNYLNEMSLIAMKYGATIDKYIGDAIVIFFGDPESKGVREDALLCVSMAIEMKLRMNELRVKWTKDGITKPFEIRMGINTGYCTVGNFGSDCQLDYTIIGSNVNLASRLESSAETNEILISKDTYQLIKDSVNCIKKDKISVKGFDYPIQTYQVIDTYHRNYFEEKANGFLLSVDFDNPDIDKVKIANTLENILEKLNR